MGWWDALKGIAKVGTNFIPGVGPFISAGLTMGDMLGNPADKMKTYNSFMPENNGYAGDNMPGAGGQGGGGRGGIGGVWDWAKENPQFSIPIGYGIASAVGNIPESRREAEYMKQQTAGSGLQNALMKLNLDRRKQFQPAYDTASTMLPEILKGNGPVKTYLSGLSTQKKTFGPSIEDKLRMYLQE